VPQAELERQVLEHLSTKLFALSRIRQMVRQLSREISKLRKANIGKLSALEASLQDVRLRLKRQHEAIECGAVDMTLVGDRLRELKAQEQELVEEMERACGPRPLPPYLLKEESLLSIQRNLQQVFLLNGNGVAKRYLAFLLERIEVNGDEVRLEANPAALLAGGLQAGEFAGGNQLPPVLTVDYDWLPNRYNCKNLTEVISFSLLRPEAHKAKGRLRPCPTRESALRVALEFRRMPDDGVVRNQAEVARLRGVSRARVTQLVNITRLPQAILDCLLGLPAEEQVLYTERRLRRISVLPTEEE
jgi:hypothetical protein